MSFLTLNSDQSMHRVSILTRPERGVKYFDSTCSGNKLLVVGIGNWQKPIENGNIIATELLSMFSFVFPVLDKENCTSLSFPIKLPNNVEPRSISAQVSATGDMMRPTLEVGYQNKII
jgi:hypothetical protein